MGILVAQFVACALGWYKIGWVNLLLEYPQCKNAQKYAPGRERRKDRAKREFGDWPLACNPTSSAY
jgi:hypothetical protein